MFHHYIDSDVSSTILSSWKYKISFEGQGGDNSSSHIVKINLHQYFGNFHPFTTWKYRLIESNVTLVNISYMIFINIFKCSICSICGNSLLFITHAACLTRNTKIFWSTRKQLVINTKQSAIDLKQQIIGKKEIFHICC